MKLLAGDIGGTNARLVLYNAPDDYEQLKDYKSIPNHKVISQMYYKNNDFKSFTEIMCSFMALPGNSNIKIHSCCLAVAGPVADNHINFTNREGWIIDGNSIMEEFGIDSVVLINDFVANGYGILSLSQQELHTLQPGKSSALDTTAGPIALIGAGTGLGECYLTPSANGTVQAHASEGGHVEFAPRTILEQDLLNFLQERLNVDSRGDDKELLPRVSVERLVSGKGLENIYEFLRERHPDQIDANFDADYMESNERGRLIGTEKYNYRLFKRALEIMFGIFGGEAGNVALKYLPYGGIYIAGGIAPKNIEFITNQESEFMARFLSKGRMSSVMPDFPVHVVMKEDLGLRGAHGIASQKAAELLAKSMLQPSTNIMKPEIVKAKKEYLSFSETLQEAITTYPLTYAFVTSSTAAITAASLAGVFQVLRTKKML